MRDLAWEKVGRRLTQRGAGGLGREKTPTGEQIEGEGKGYLEVKFYVPIVL